MLLEKGPNVTLAVLKAFTQPDTLAVSCNFHRTVCLHMLSQGGSN